MGSDKNDDTAEDIITKIDKAVGPPESETPEQRARRKKLVESNLRARQIRKSSERPA